MHAGSNAVQQWSPKQPVSAQVRPLVKLATVCAQGLETFSKVWRMSHIVRNKGKSTTAYKEVREDTFVLKFLY